MRWLAVALACAFVLPPFARADDDWGEPPGGGGDWGEPAAPAPAAPASPSAPAGSVRARFAPRAFDLAGRRIECGVPDGWVAGPLEMDAPLPDPRRQGRRARAAEGGPDRELDVLPEMREAGLPGLRVAGRGACPT